MDLSAPKLHLDVVELALGPCYIDIDIDIDIDR